MKTFFISSVLFAALGFIAGCVSLEKSYPDKRYFVLEASRAESAANANAKAGGVLLVSSLRVSPRYEGRSFVYRRGDASFESDFYHQFLVSPGALLTEEVRRALAQAQVAQYVIGAASQLEPTHNLEGSVDALYGDFRDLNAPKAILEMEFFLSQESPTKAEIVTRKRYVKSIAVNGRTPEALVKGWNDALNEILTALVADLKAVKF
jgi:cholesterol transport system auxiliary component